MKPFATALLLSVAIAGQASALSISMSLPNLTFPTSTTATTVSSQNATAPVLNSK